MVDKGHLRIATRASALARRQAEEVARMIEERAGILCDFRFVTSEGDRDTGSRLAAIGGSGVFTKEVEKLLLDGEADVAVHSLKDLPVRDDELIVAAYPPRADPRDSFVPAERLGPTAFDSLPFGARVATSSPRREALIRSYRPDIDTVSIRGNVETRIRKIDEGFADGTLLAIAGLERLAIDRFRDPLAVERFPPAAGQGILAVQARNSEIAALVAALDHPATREVAEAERAVLRELEGGCNSSLGVHIEASGRGFGVREVEGVLRRISVMDSTPAGAARKLIESLR